jgi:hypothetical protein
MQLAIAGHPFSIDVPIATPMVLPGQQIDLIPTVVGQVREALISGGREQGAVTSDEVTIAGNALAVDVPIA